MFQIFVLILSLICNKIRFQYCSFLNVHEEHSNFAALGSHSFNRSLFLFSNKTKYVWLWRYFEVCLNIKVWEILERELRENWECSDFEPETNGRSHKDWNIVHFNHASWLSTAFIHDFLGSIYLTLAIAVERYVTVCHPFFKVSL